MTRSKRSTAPVAQLSPRSRVAEAYHTIRTNIQFRDASSSRSIVVTSANRGEGRTLTACNLAVTFSQSGCKVLLIDADLRNPQLHERFRTDNELGLRNVLEGDQTLADCVQRSEIAGLHLLTCGAKPDNPASLISVDRLETLLASASGGYDMVIFDSPPVLTASDALVMARTADGTVMVVDAKQTSRVVAQKTVSLLLQMNAHLVGGVLNRVPKRRRKYPMGAVLQQSPYTTQG